MVHTTKPRNEHPHVGTSDNDGFGGLFKKRLCCKIKIYKNRATYTLYVIDFSVAAKLQFLPDGPGVVRLRKQYQFWSSCGGFRWVCVLVCSVIHCHCVHIPAVFMPVHVDITGAHQLGLSLRAGFVERQNNTMRCHSSNTTATASYTHPDYHQTL